MRTIALLVKREYLERVRTRSFIVSTLLLPAFMVGMMIIPGKMAMMKTNEVHRIVVVSDDAEFARAVKSQLESSKQTINKVEISDQIDDNARAALKERVNSALIDAYLWTPSAALNEGKVTVVARQGSETAMEASSFRSIIKSALLREELVKRGLSSSEVDALGRDLTVDAITMKGGREKTANSIGEFVGIVGMIMMLYMTVLIYGMSVMRSVIEEKTSRVVEVMLSSARPFDMMAGKVVGVGAVGLTQVLAWAVIALLGSVPTLMALGGQKNPIFEISPLVAGSFAVFFLLGYLLYSTLYATLGAMVNSDQEAQQWQMFVTLPIVIPVVMMTAVLRQPHASFAVWMSLVPFFAPILMFARVVVETPPVWQIALSLALLVASIGAALWVCSRIYRIGILMYGKRPTLPEIVKWARHA